jgi:hypothetical protein
MLYQYIRGIAGVLVALLLLGAMVFSLVVNG